MKNALSLCLLFMLAWSANAGEMQSAISYEQLAGGTALSFPVQLSAFAPPPDAMPPSNVFQGDLTLDVANASGGFEVLKDQYSDATANDKAAQHLPAFDFQFVQSDGVLIPARRGAIPSANPEWEFILEPGRVWDQPSDHGMTRAAIPFTLEERNANCMHNGVLTFLFGKAGVSKVAFEIGSETCFYFKFNMWGLVPAHYVQGEIPKAASIIADYTRDVADRLPTKAIASLGDDIRGADPKQFGSPFDVPAGDMTAYGVVVNGVNYVGGCNTRFGPYPYCDVLDLPSYSLAKTIVAGLGTMRLALLYPGVTSETIARYVPDCAAAETWADVTFANALDMATGHYLRAGDQEDENAPDLTPFFVADTHAEKIAFACMHYPRKDAPGTRWIYHTADTYILGAALAEFYRSKMGGDFYNDILGRDIWTRLKLSPPVYVSRRTYGQAAQPFTGYGLTLHRDDIAKIATFINVDHGVLGGKPLLDPVMLRAALQQDPTSPGLRASTGEFRYHYGVWAWNAQSYLGCKAPAWIPFMSGYGGIAVAMFPNGISYYYFSDSGIWRWGRAAAEANRIKPFCAK